MSQAPATPGAADDDVHDEPIPMMQQLIDNPFLLLFLTLLLYVSPLPIASLSSLLTFHTYSPPPSPPPIPFLVFPPFHLTFPIFSRVFI